MSPTSYQLLHPAINLLNIITFILKVKNFFVEILAANHKSIYGIHCEASWKRVTVN